MYYQKWRKQIRLFYRTVKLKHSTGCWALGSQFNIRERYMYRMWWKEEIRWSQRNGFRSKKLPLGRKWPKQNSRLENLNEIWNKMVEKLSTFTEYIVKSLWPKGKIPVPGNCYSGNAILQKWRQNAQIHEYGSTNDKTGHHNELKMIEKFIYLIAWRIIMERTNDSPKKRVLLGNVKYK